MNLRSTWLNTLVALFLLSGLVTNGMLICQKADESSRLELSCGDGCGAKLNQSVPNKKNPSDFEFVNNCKDIQLSLEQVYRPDNERVQFVKTKDEAFCFKEFRPCFTLASLYSKPIVHSTSPPHTIHSHLETTILLI